MLDVLLAFDQANRRMKAQFEADTGARVERGRAEQEARPRTRVVSSLAARLLGRGQRPGAASAGRSVRRAGRLEPKRH
jgi:hypothetical protein